MVTVVSSMQCKRAILIYSFIRYKAFLITLFDWNGVQSMDKVSTNLLITPLENTSD